MFERSRRWKKELREATIAAAFDARERAEGQHLYAFGLYTSGEVDDFNYVVATANTEEAFERAVRSAKERRGGSEALLRRRLRWSAADWAYHDCFPGVSSVSLPPLGSTRRDAAVRSAFFAALSAADEAGAFGRGSERDGVTVALLCGDMSDEFLLRGVRNLNPAAVVSRFLERDTPAPFLARLATLPADSRAKTLVTLWEALALDSDDALADDARARGVTAFDIEKLVAREGRSALPPVADVIERHAFGEAWFEKGSPEFERWGAARRPVALASRAAFLLLELGLDASDVPRFQRLIATRVALDRALERPPTLSENLARVLHVAFPRQFPRTIMGPNNHLENADPFLPR